MSPEEVVQTLRGMLAIGALRVIDARVHGRRRDALEVLRDPPPETSLEELIAIATLAFKGERYRQPAGVAEGDVVLSSDETARLTMLIVATYEANRAAAGGSDVVAPPTG
jgi:hypothetical protein